MDWQQSVSLVIVAAATVLLLRGTLRRGKPALGPRGCCTVAGGAAASRQETVVFRARKGERPEIRVKLK